MRSILPGILELLNTYPILYVFLLALIGFIVWANIRDYVSGKEEEKESVKRLLVGLKFVIVWLGIIMVIVALLTYLAD